jgi:uncharacterized membrane protein YdjX (TVP38/TMEM64 family)
MQQIKTIKKYKSWILLGLLIIGAGAFWLSGAASYFSLEYVQDANERLNSFVREHPITSRLMFCGLYISAVTLSLPIASMLTLLAGFLFGVVVGTVMVVFSATIGATMIFLIAKSTLGEGLRAKAHGLYQKIESGFNDNAFFYLLFLRLAPIFPFALINIVPALVNMHTVPFALATFLGIIPGTTVYVFAGRSLATIEKASDILSPQVIIAFAALSALGLVPVLIKKFKNRKNRHDKN